MINRRNFIKLFGSSSLIGCIPSICFGKQTANNNKKLPILELPEIEIKTNNILGGIFTTYQYKNLKTFNTQNDFMIPVCKYSDYVDFLARFVDDRRISIINRAYQVSKQQILNQLDQDAYNLLKDVAEFDLSKTTYNYQEAGFVFDLNCITHILVNPINTQKLNKRKSLLVTHFYRHVKIVENNVCDEDKIIGVNASNPTNFAAYNPIGYEFKIKPYFARCIKKNELPVSIYTLYTSGKMGMVCTDSSKVIIGNI
jgi:hypothetical protein